MGILCEGVMYPGLLCADWELDPHGLHRIEETNCAPEKTTSSTNDAGKSG